MLSPKTRQDVFSALADQIADGKLVLVAGSGLDFDMLAGTASAWLAQNFEALIALDGPPVLVEAEGGGRVVFVDLADESMCEIMGLELIDLGGPDLVVLVEEDPPQYRWQYDRYLLPAAAENIHSDIWVLNV